MKKENIIFTIVLSIVFLLLIGTLIGIYIKVNEEKPVRVTTSEDGSFSSNFIKMSNDKIGKTNYMISPYSVEMALSMLRDGTSTKTREELDKVVPERTIKTLSVEGKVNIANAIFIKEIYQNDLVLDYKDNLKKKYQAEIIVDKFTNPDKINDWVNKETNKMIPKILNQIPDSFVLGLANAIAMEETWLSPFECESTKKDEFTKIDNTKEKKLFMNKTFDDSISYFENEDSKGIIMPYNAYNPETGKEAELFDEENEQLEFIAILPNDINTYISNFTLDTLKDIKENKKEADDLLEITVSIPKFEYEYDFKKLKETLIDMGIESVFSPNDADLSGMLNNHPEAYVDEAIHKTYIKVEEKGTKAAAITYFGVKDSAMPIGETEYINIKFDKPFVYLIKDVDSNEILFFGVVYDPKWDENNSCE